MRRIAALCLTVAVCLSASPAWAKHAKHATRACESALAAAEQLSSYSSGYASDLAEYFTSIRDAVPLAEAGDMVGFFDSMTAATNTLTGKTTTLTANVNATGATFRVNAARCRAGR